MSHKVLDCTRNCGGAGFSKCMLITVRVAVVYCICVCDLKPGCVCRQRRESVAGGRQLVSKGHFTVFRYHHSRIEIYTHSRERDLKWRYVQSGVAGKMYLLPWSQIISVQNPYS